MMEFGETLTGASGEMKIIVQRDGKQVTVRVTLPEAPWDALTSSSFATQALVRR